MMTFISAADYERVHRNKVPICPGGIGFIEPQDERLRRIVGYAMTSKTGFFRTTVNATTGPTAFR
jgi:hypothetical protein